MWEPTSTSIVDTWCTIFAFTRQASRSTSTVPGHVRGFEHRVRIDEVHQRAVVIDRIDCRSQVRVRFRRETQLRLGEIAQHGRTRASKLGVPRDLEGLGSRF